MFVYLKLKHIPRFANCCAAFVRAFEERLDYKIS